MKGTKIILVTAVFLLAITLAGCRRTPDADRSTFERVQHQLLSMTSYTADATITYISNRSQHTYQVRQMARTSGEYRIEVIGPERVAGNVTINDNRTITQFNTRVQGQYSVIQGETPERLELFVTSFVRNYLRSQEVTVSVAAIDNSLATVLEAEIPGSHPYMSSAKLWVSNETLKPMQMIIFDPDGTQRIVIAFQNFEYNVDIDDRMFRMQ